MSSAAMTPTDRARRGPDAADTALPALYISHGGGPWPFMPVDPPDMYDGLASWLRGIPEAIGARPNAVLAVSAHWEEDELTVMHHAQPPMLYDYYGFPAATYRLRYDAPGSPALAERVEELLRGAGLGCRSDFERGFDHGVFVPFMLAYPDADMPIVQLSLRRDLDPAFHLAVGRALAPLRAEGVLIAGSGMSYHNLRAFGPAGRPASEQFDRWLVHAVAATGAARDSLLVQWSAAPAARAAHPRADHLLPLMVTAGAAELESGRATFSGRILGVQVSCFQFGPPAAAVALT
jgi:aromatic ring-opening dioxygenase catalytic subunit (LigB family)